MNVFFKILLAPFALIYWCITSFRNFLFNRNIKRSLSFSLPIINVGNLSMGGTGKTPHIEMLIRLFKSQYKVATLSRGYGRKVYGFQLANEQSSAHTIGDEPYQFYRKFGDDISVAVDADRVAGVSEICLKVPDVELVLLDDAYQHRHIKPGYNILLTDFSKPFYEDFVLPVGTLREARSGKKRADCIIVTKCPDNLSEKQKQNIRAKMAPLRHQNVFFSQITYGEVKPLTKISNSLTSKKWILLVTGIANADPLYNYLAKTYNIIKHFKFPDHYAFKPKDITEIHNLLIKFADDNPVVITTEKDAMRLMNEDMMTAIKAQPWFYQTIKVELDRQKDFNKIIEKYVQENSRDY